MQAKQMYEESENENADIVDMFLTLLNKKIYEAKDILIERYNWICSQDPSAAKFMYENNLGIGFDGKTIESVMKHFTLAIGQIGLAETLQILIGCDHTESRGMEVAKRIEELFSNNCKTFKENYRLNFAVYYTPAEGLCYTALKKFRDKYGIIPNVSDREYFTNSIHVPVWKQMSPFQKINIESQLTGYSTAGCITYVELPSGMLNNLEALEVIVNYAMDKDIPYFAINVPVDECQDCGYSDEMNDICKQCGGSHVTHLRRVTGYLSGDYMSSFNLGKQAEVKDREKHLCDLLE
jgi:ribonucleoside-triphosphate reductase